MKRLLLVPMFFVIAALSSGGYAVAQYAVSQKSVEGRTTYHLIDSIHSANREEAYGEDWNTLNNFVRQDLNAHLQDTFKEEFLGKRFNAGNKEYEVASLDDVKIFLPWPRAYEVRLEFKMQAREVPPIAQVMNQRTP